MWCCLPELWLLLLLLFSLPPRWFADNNMVLRCLYIVQWYWGCGYRAKAGPRWGGLALQDFGGRLWERQGIRWMKCAKSHDITQWYLVKNRPPPPNILLILTHHLKGLSLSFQKIIKLTLLDQRNWSYSRSKMLYLTLGICNSPFSAALWLLAVVSLPLVLWGTQRQPWEWRGRNWVCLHLTETNGSAPCNTHCSADDLWWWGGGGVTLYTKYWKACYVTMCAGNLKRGGCK